MPQKTTQRLPQNLSEDELRVRIRVLFNEHIIPILENLGEEELECWAHNHRIHKIEIKPRDTWACHEIWVYVPQGYKKRAAQHLKDYFLPCLGSYETIRTMLGTHVPKIIIYAAKARHSWDAEPTNLSTRMALEMFLNQSQAEACRMTGISEKQVEEPAPVYPPEATHEDVESEFQTAS
jgi:hypothetical protein